MQPEELRQQGLEILVRNNTITFYNPFIVYTSGKIGPYKVDCGTLLKNPRDITKAAELLAFLYREMESQGQSPTTRITGGESIDWIFSNRVAENINISAAMLYKDGHVRGADLKDHIITHIADVNSEGSSIIYLWRPLIHKQGALLKQTLFFVERCERGKELLAEKIITSRAVVELDSYTWSRLSDMKAITYQEYGEVCLYRENRESWANNNLRSDAGLAHLAELLTSEKASFQQRAHTLLMRGYPDLAEELMQTLINRQFIKPEQAQVVVESMMKGLAHSKRIEKFE
ncbi:MAG: hypothetical protein AABY00_01290 [Nanoarchaeota archaeon]